MERRRKIEKSEPRFRGGKDQHMGGDHLASGAGMPRTEIGNKGSKIVYCWFMEGSEL